MRPPWVKALPSKPNSPSLMPRTNMAEGEDHLPSLASYPLTLTPASIQSKNKNKN